MWMAKGRGELAAVSSGTIELSGNGERTCGNAKIVEMNVSLAETQMLRKIGRRGCEVAVATARLATFSPVYNISLVTPVRVRSESSLIWEHYYARASAILLAQISGACIVGKVIRPGFVHASHACIRSSCRMRFGFLHNWPRFHDAAQLAARAVS